MKITSFNIIKPMDLGIHHDFRIFRTPNPAWRQVSCLSLKSAHAKSAQRLGDWFTFGFMREMTVFSLVV